MRKNKKQNLPDNKSNSGGNAGYTANIFLPAGAMGANEFDDELDTILREVAEKHQQDGEWAEKYGIDVDNEIFMMHHYCWCEKENCEWCGWEDDKQTSSPNFWYKPLDFKVWWYKYIGRGVETNKTLAEEQLKEMREKCLSA